MIATDHLCTHRDINKVEQTMADIEDQRLLADEVSRAIASPVTGDIIDEVTIICLEISGDVHDLCRTSSRTSSSSSSKRSSMHNSQGLRMCRPMCPSVRWLDGSVSLRIVIHVCVHLSGCHRSATASGTHRRRDGARAAGITGSVGHVVAPTSTFLAVSSLPSLCRPPPLWILS